MTNLDRVWLLLRDFMCVDEQEGLVGGRCCWGLRVALGGEEHTVLFALLVLEPVTEVVSCEYRLHDTPEWDGLHWIIIRFPVCKTRQTVRASSGVLFLVRVVVFVRTVVEVEASLRELPRHPDIQISTTENRSVAQLRNSPLLM